MPDIKYCSLIFILLIITVGLLSVTFQAVKSQAVEVPPPPKICGDGIVQVPNDSGAYEKCDSSGVETDECTASCGQKMLGWAWSSNSGWLSLNNKNCDYVDPAVPPGDRCVLNSTTHYVQIDAVNQIFGWSWADNLGWVCFCSSCSGLGGTTPSGGWQAQIYGSDFGSGVENPRVIGWAKILSLGDDGWISFSYLNEAAPQANYQVRLIQKDFGATPNISQRLTLNGWSWNGNDNGAGLGWLQFDSEISAISPWLQTKYGDIYGRGDISGVTPPPSYNATYRILAGGAVTNFTSAHGIDFWVDQNYGPINFPTPETGYTNVLGKLDVKSLLCDFAGGNTCLNKSGRTVVDLTKPGQGLQTNQLLAGKIYYNNGNLIISSPIQFINGNNFENGAGTIIVDGDLEINANVTYAPTGALTRFRNLASAAWIVRGDLKISGNVENLAGNFIVIGNGLNSCDPPQAGCGQIFTCFDNGNSCQFRLTTSGLMMARRFDFRRLYKDQLEGSEIIVYDGRLLANTPPGLGDFAKALPIWRSNV